MLLEAPPKSLKANPTLKTLHEVERILRQAASKREGPLSYAEIARRMPAKAVRWQETPQGREARLGGVLIDRYGAGENAGYPTLCKGRFDVDAEDNYYAIEEPTSLNTLELLPQLMQMGVRAVKIEGRQRSPAYVAQVTQVWREAIDQCTAAPQRYAPRTNWMASLDQVAEGQQHTLGAYHRPWK